MNYGDQDSHEQNPFEGNGVPGGKGGGPVWDFDAWDHSAWGEGLSAEQLALQSDLSCLVDGELDEPAAARAMVALEESSECREFFDDLRRFARLHRDMSDPDRLEARLVMLGSSEVARAAENVDLAHRLATIFYQLGKAYTLAALDSDGFAERVFESAVPVDELKRRGRGFVDGVVATGRGEARGDADRVGGTDALFDGARGVDWMRARHLLNGRLERIENPLEKGRRLLEQAIEIDASHEEARIYLAFLHSREGRNLRSSNLYREVFETGIDLANRGHAAMQLGRLYHREGDLRSALRYWRWMSICGLAELDHRFALAHFNIGLTELQRGSADRALTSFRKVLDAYIGADQPIADVARLFAENDDARQLIESKPGFPERLVATLPELFAAPA